MKGDSNAVIKNVTIALAGGFVLAFPLLWLLELLPQMVSVHSGGIGIRQNVISYDEISWAVVGTSNIDGTEFPVLTFETKNNCQHIFGISKKVSLKELRNTLAGYGVRIE